MYRGRMIVSIDIYCFTRNTNVRFVLKIKKEIIYICHSALYRFIINDKDTFFSVSQRSLIVNELLLRTRYEDERDKFGKIFFTFIEIYD